MLELKKIQTYAMLPRVILIKNNAISDIGKICMDLRLSNSVLIVCDKITKKIAGDEISENLTNQGFSTVQLIIDDATDNEVKRAEKIINQEKFQFVIGVGGGRAIDVAKLSSFYCKIPFLNFPTAVSHDGIASSRASIRIENVNTSIKAHTPLGIIADTKILAESPYRLFASGCGDIISNLSAIEDWILANKIKNEYIDFFAMELSKFSAEILIENIELIKKKNEDSITLLLKSLLLSGVAMALVDSSRPASGSEHKFSHALDRISSNPALHGEQCALGTIMMMHLYKKDWKKIVTVLKKIGLPTNSKEIGIPKSEIIEALMLAPKIRPERYTVIDEGMSKEKAEKLARDTFVID